MKSRSKNLSAGAMILASKSPRRAEILSGMGVVFEMRPLNQPEDCRGLHPAQAPTALAMRKASALATAFPERLVMGADTMILFGGSALGKPSSKKDAAAMLSRLSGEIHDVVTGVCLMWREKNIEIIFSETSTVAFKKLSRNDIDLYISLVDTLDKAGSYAVQEHGDIIVESVRGPLSNVVGLPAARVHEALSHLRRLFPDELSEALGSLAPPSARAD